MSLRSLVRMVSNLKLKHLVLTLIPLSLLVHLSGLLSHLKELDYYKEFTYPMEGDIYKWMEQIKKGGDQLKVKVANDYNEHMRIKHAKGKCIEEDGVHYTKLRVVYIVKSALGNFARRKAIRRTWGYERRFSDVPIRTVFLLGSDPNRIDLMKQAEEEYRTHGDLIQGDFLDSYFNNTLKTMMGLRWAVEQCPTARFYFFVDDDYYVSTRNVLRFLRNPVNYPHYLEDPVISFDEDSSQSFKNRKLHQLVDFDLPSDVKLYAGHVIHSPPHRHTFSKWYVTLDEYPYHMWPPYVTAGAYVLSRDALIDFYYGSYFVKRFRFDDVYLGIVAKKLGIEPFHCDEFHFSRKPYSVVGYRYVVASHDFQDPEELERVWNEQKQAGNA